MRRRLLAAAVLALVALVAAPGSTLAAVTTAWLRSVTFVPGSTTTVLTAGQNGAALKSTDSGTSWYPCSSGYDGWLKSVAFSNASTGIAVPDVANVVKRTTDGGSSWATVTVNDLGQATFEDADIAGGVGWVVGAKDGHAIVFKSTDGGATWTRSFQFTPPPYTPGESDPPEPPTYNNRFMAVDFIDADRGWAVGYQQRPQLNFDPRDGPPMPIAYSTTNGGDTWTTRTVDASAPWLRLYDVSFVDASNGLVVGEQGAIYRTTNGGSTWTRQRLGASSEQLSGVDFVAPDTAYAVGGILSSNQQRVYKWTSATSTWKTARPTTPNYLSGVDFTSRDHGVVVGNNGEIAYTTDGGSTWTAASGAVPPIAVSRVAGADKFLTAVEVSEGTFAGADYVVVASGAGFPDALAASGLTGVLRAPLLLSNTTTISPSALDEIRRLGAKKVFIVGGPAVISEGVRCAIADVLPSKSLSNVARIGGGDRYETARRVAEKIKSVRVAWGQAVPRTVFVVNGIKFPDALSVAPYANSQGFPVLLTKPTSLPGHTAAAIRAVSARKAVVAGGSVVVSDGVRTAIANNLANGYKTVSNVPRWSGRDRYRTARAVADNAVGQGWATHAFVGIATGEDFPYALSGGVAAGVNGGTLLLTKRTALSSATSQYLTAHKGSISAVVIYGPTSSLSSYTETQIRNVVD